MESYLHCVYCHSRTVLAMVISGYGYKYRCIDRILLNFQRTVTNSNLLITKVLPSYSLPSHAWVPKEENQEMTWGRIYAAFLSGLVLFS